MKKQISIFIAGSKDFRQQRLSLKALANDLNAEFHDQKKNVVLQMFSYENFGDNQQDYNQFIEDAADMVIFVLEGGIGEHTRDEFRRAATKFKKEGSPKICVFLKDFQEPTLGIQSIERMLEDILGSEYYYISYSNTDDLCAKAKERIQTYVHHIIRRRKVFRQCIAAVMLLLVLISCSGVAYYLQSIMAARKNFEPMLVFVGGGSAANYMAAHYHYNVYNDSLAHSLYLNMPSKQGNLLMADEIFENHAKNANPTKNNCFYPVFLSASRSTESDFIDSNVSDEKDEFTKLGIIISYYLGGDSLVAYFYYRHKKDVPKELRNSKVIQASYLQQLISNEKRMKIFTTRDSSGTRIAYQKNMNNILDSIDSERKAFFYQTTEMKSLRDDTQKYKGFIMLGSGAYKANAIDTFMQDNPEYCFARPIALGDSMLQKPIYVYLAAFRRGDDKYTIPSVGRKFLNHIYKHDNDSVTEVLKLKSIDEGEVVRPIQDFIFIKE